MGAEIGNVRKAKVSGYSGVVCMKKMIIKLDSFTKMLNINSIPSSID